MTRDDILNEYFEWLYAMVCEHRYSERISYRRLLMHLHNTEFRYSIPNDQNRAENGTYLRWRFARDHGMREVPACIDGPCSVLEMMIALAIQCEETIMDDPAFGNRLGQWFWGMIINLGLGAMTDGRYDRREVNRAIDRLLDRDYEPDGRGGLFTVRNCHRDMREVEIFWQLCYYLDSIT